MGNTYYWLVFGWSISEDGLLRYLKETEAKSCSNAYQCTCGKECWWPGVQGEFELLAVPKKGCYGSDLFFLALAPKSKEFTVKEVNAIVENTEFMDRARKLAAQLGVDPRTEPTIMYEQKDFYS
jgi:hypothetical protein